MDQALIPVARLPVKRKDFEITKWNLCIFCQVVSSGNLTNGGKEGVNRVKECYYKRISYSDVNNWDVLKRLEPDIETLELKDPKWHKASCYASFCSKSNIDRLKIRFEKAVENPITNISSSSDTDNTQPCTSVPATRGRIPTVNWSLCIICQLRKNKGSIKLSQVLTKNGENSIHEIAKSDEELRCRTAGLDLIAYEAKYHKSCYANRFQNNTADKKNTSIQDTSSLEIAMTILIEELDKGFKAGHVYSLDQVTEHYRGLVAEIQGSDCSYSTQKLKGRLQSYYGDRIDFVQPLQRSQSMIIFPRVPVSVAMQALKFETDKIHEIDVEDELTIADCPSEEGVFLQALQLITTKIRTDLNSTEGHTSYGNLNIDHAKKTIPDSLYMLLKMLINRTSEEDDPEEVKLLSILQDIVSVASKGRKVTPKQIGIGLSVHQATRSKQLVQLLHASGHSISYERVQRIHASIYKNQLQRFTTNGNIFIPENFVFGRFAQFAADNLDINEETLDGKGTFHVTQMVAFQRGPAPNHAPDLPETIGLERVIKDIPSELNKILPSKYRRIVPKFSNTQNADDLLQTNEIVEEKVHALDIAWLLSRTSNSEDEQHVPAWRGFNQVVSETNTQVTTVGYLPIIPAPATDYDTLWTVIDRCQKIAGKIGLKHTVLTFDESLYSKVKELTWYRPEECQGLVLRLGSFHIAMNFLIAIGQHFSHSGLTNVWTESGVFTETTSQNILDGKNWNRSFRTHSLTYEALWRIYWTKFLQWVQETDRTVDSDIEQLCDLIVSKFKINNFSGIQETVKNELFPKAKILQKMFIEFEETLISPTSKYWLEYKNMVQTLLDFVRAEREGIWQLHLSSLSKMIPWMVMYDHTNYARYGPIYLSDMKQLSTTAPDVYNEFESGNFVIKSTTGRFNQIPVDQALEHVNKKGKTSGGLIGITRIESARDEWCLTYNGRSKLSEDTRRMVGLADLEDLDEQPHIERGKQRITRDERDVMALKDQFQVCDVFSDTPYLLNISTKEVASEDIQKDLLTAFERGKVATKAFINDRMQPDSNVTVFDTISRHNSKTFKSLGKVVPAKEIKRKSNVSDALLLRRLVVAADSGRNVDLKQLLQYELHDVPLSLATYDGCLRLPTNKAMLGTILIGDNGVDILPVEERGMRTCYIIDAMGVVQALGKPSKAKTFGDLADSFVKLVLQNFSEHTTRIDVVFDSYKNNSIKSATRAKRKSKSTPLVRRDIQDRNVPLPQNWNGFISLLENKKALTHFLSNQLMDVSSKKLNPNQVVVTAGGYEQCDKATSTSGILSDSLFANHEEADTRILLHAKDATNNGYSRIVVQCKDTDVLVMLVNMFQEIHADEVWMSKGTSSQKIFVPVHTIFSGIPTDVRESIIGFHSITGCDTTSQPNGIGKKTAWEVYLKNPKLLAEIGVGTLSDSAIKSAEDFFISIYSRSLHNADTSKSINELRELQFGKKSPEMLPPTYASLKLHIQRAHYQAFVWKKALEAKPLLPDLLDCGWYDDNGELKPKLMGKDPFPPTYKQLVQCGCTTDCARSNCVCTVNKLPCLKVCGCSLEQCKNIYSNQDDEDETV